MSRVRLTIRPLRLRAANAYVAETHRHHKPDRGHRWSIGAFDGDRCVGVAIVGRPKAKAYDPDRVAEVTRLSTDGTKNACSLLYAAAARAAEAMGFDRIQTYVLESESGVSLRAAGWTCEGSAGGGDWNRPSRSGRRTDQPQEPKVRWAKTLTNAARRAA